MKNLLIIGAGSAGQMVLNEIVKHNTTADMYKIIGFLDDDSFKKEVLNLPVLGKINEAECIIKKYNIQDVIISIPSAKKEVINRILSHLSNTFVRTRIVPGLYEIIEGKVTLQQIRDIQPNDLLGREEIGFDINSITSFYKNKKIIITGAGGSIGSEILLQLIKLPIKKIIAFGHGENSIYNILNKLKNDKRFEYIIGDIKDKNKLNYELKRYKPDIFFHAAAHKHVPLMEDYPDEAVKNNIIGTYNCALSAIENNTTKFILISTDKAVNPTSVMGATKRIAEKIVLSLNKIQNSTNFSLTRFGNVLSSRGSVVPIFKSQIENGGPLTITHKDISGYFMSIPEASRLVIKALTINKGNIFILDMGEPIKILDLAKNMIKLYGYNEDQIKIIFTGLRPGEKMFEELLTNSENTTKTIYDKLLISTEIEKTFSSKELSIMMNEFQKIVETYDKEKIKLLLKKYVSEYRIR